MFAIVVKLAALEGGQQDAGAPPDNLDRSWIGGLQNLLAFVEVVERDHRVDVVGGMFEDIQEEDIEEWWKIHVDRARDLILKVRPIGLAVEPGDLGICVLLVGHKASEPEEDTIGTGHGVDCKEQREGTVDGDRHAVDADDFCDEKQGDYRSVEPEFSALRRHVFSRGEQHAFPIELHEVTEPDAGPTAVETLEKASGGRQVAVFSEGKWRIAGIFALEIRPEVMLGVVRTFPTGEGMQRRQKREDPDDAVHS